MIKQLITLEEKMGERSYKLICEVDSPLGELYDALTKMKSFVIFKMQELEPATKVEEKKDG